MPSKPEINVILKCHSILSVINISCVLKCFFFSFGHYKHKCDKGNCACDLTYYTLLGKRKLMEVWGLSHPQSRITQGQIYSLYKKLGVKRSPQFFVYYNEQRMF